MWLDSVALPGVLASLSGWAWLGVLLSSGVGGGAEGCNSASLPAQRQTRLQGQQNLFEDQSRAEWGPTEFSELICATVLDLQISKTTSCDYYSGAAGRNLVRQYGHGLLEAPPRQIHTGPSPQIAL